jgi:hypothetical protein
MQLYVRIEDYCLQVPVPPQLKSHRLFAGNFEHYVVSDAAARSCCFLCFLLVDRACLLLQDLVDEAQLFDTTEWGRPRLIAQKALGRSLLVDPARFARMNFR